MHPLFPLDNDDLKRPNARILDRIGEIALRDKAKSKEESDKNPDRLYTVFVFFSYLGSRWVD